MRCIVYGAGDVADGVQALAAQVRSYAETLGAATDVECAASPREWAHADCVIALMGECVHIGRDALLAAPANTLLAVQSPPIETATKVLVAARCFEARGAGVIFYDDLDVARRFVRAHLLKWFLERAFPIAFPDFTLLRRTRSNYTNVRPLQHWPRAGAGDGWRARVRHGNALLRSGRLSSALAVYDLALSHGCPDEESALAICANRGVLHRLRGRHDLALQDFQHVIRTASYIGSLHLAAIARVETGIVHYAARDWPLAEACWENALEIGRETRDAGVQAYAWLWKGKQASKRKDLDSAAESFRKALRHHRLRRSSLASAAYIHLAKILQKKNKHSECLQYAGRALQIDTALGNAPGLTEDLGFLSAFYTAAGDRSKSEWAACAGAQMAEWTADAPELVTGYGHLALIARRAGAPEIARSLFCAALDLSERIGRDDLYAVQSANLGVLYASGGQTAAALERLERAGRVFAGSGMDSESRQVGRLIAMLESASQDSAPNISS